MKLFLNSYSEVFLEIQSDCKHPDYRVSNMISLSSVFQKVIFVV